MNEAPPEKRFRAANWAVGEVDHLFSRLARYTKFVALSKWFLMLFAVGLMATLITVPLLGKDRSGIRVSFVDKGLGKQAAATSPVMNAPEYRGTSDKGDQFKVGGARATQVSPTRIVIDQVEGQMISPSGSWRSLTATRADYDQTAKTIQISGQVTLVDEQGYSFTTESAMVNTETMEVTGNQPIQGVGPMGNLLASSFKISDNGQRIIFMRGAEPLHLRIDRKAKKQ